MREIKFRGKRIDNGEWAYGAFVPDELEQTHGEMVTWGFIRRYKPNQTVESVEMIEVDRKTVGQYTGLKDKHGTEIYEGDIVRVDLLCSFGDEALTDGVVYWCNCAWWIDGTQNGDSEAIGGLGYCYNSIEVIDNIYDCPRMEVTP